MTLCKKKLACVKKDVEDWPAIKTTDLGKLFLLKRTYLIFKTGRVWNALLKNKKSLSLHIWKPWSVVSKIHVHITTLVRLVAQLTGLMWRQLWRLLWDESWFHLTTDLINHTIFFLPLYVGPCGISGSVQATVCSCSVRCQEDRGEQQPIWKVCWVNVMSIRWNSVYKNSM